jgi:hypothetical protein
MRRLASFVAMFLLFYRFVSVALPTAVTLPLTMDLFLLRPTLEHLDR